MARLQLLLVDDDVDFAESIAELLEYRGYGVTLAHSGEAALELVEAGHYDMVLMDMKMPGMNGVECLIAMRSLRPGIRVVMITAFTQAEFVRQALESGALAMLGKPVSPEELLKTISYLTEESSILLVEDNIELAEELRKILTQHHYKVALAATLDAAKNALARGKVDLLLLDFRLPDGTGNDLMDWLASTDLKVDTIIITGYQDEVKAALPAIGIDDILVKPFMPDQLLHKIAHFDQHSQSHG